MKVVALAGGTGSSKLLRGLSRLDADLTIVSNTGDNFWVYGLYVCPDIDTAMYALAGILDQRGWGIRNDTFHALSQLKTYGIETWFNIGDKDLATHLLRTKMLREGDTLTQITEFLTKKLGVKGTVLPATDSYVETYIVTPNEKLHLQEFWVRDNGKPDVIGIEYRGADKAKPTAKVEEAIRQADEIIICPANPVSSIGPILALNGMKELIQECRGLKIAISPMVGEGPFSGPAGKFMHALGIKSNSTGVASIYRDFLDVFVIDVSDQGLKKEIEKLGLQVMVTKTYIKNDTDAEKLARIVLDVGKTWRRRQL